MITLNTVLHNEATIEMQQIFTIIKHCRQNELNFKRIII